jgi:hypothetical protein
MKTLPNVIAAITVASLPLFAGGCASIVKGTTQAIPVASSPSGADVRLDGNHIGQTPTSVEVKRKSDHLMTIEKAGYQPESIAITRNIGGAVFGNILAGGLVGWGVDAISGAQYNLTPATINVTLKHTAGGARGGSGSESSAVIFISELKKLDALHEDKKVTDEEYAKQRTALMGKYTPPPPAEQNAQEQGQKEPYRNLAPGLSQPANPTEEKLQDLQKMRASGLITEEEYQAKRKSILERM